MTNIPITATCIAAKSPDVIAYDVAGLEGPVFGELFPAIGYEGYFNAAFTSRRLSVYVSANTCDGNRAVELTINDATVNQVAIIIASTSGWFIDTSNSDAIAAEDYVEWDTGAAAGATGGSVTIEMYTLDIEHESDYWTMFGAWIGGNFDDNDTYYPSLNAGRIVTVEAYSQVVIRHPATWTDLRFEVTANTVNASSTVASRINGADGNQTLTILAKGTGWYGPSAATDALSQGDEINYRITVPAQGGVKTINTDNWQSNFYHPRFFSLVSSSDPDATGNDPISADRFIRAGGSLYVLTAESSAYLRFHDSGASYKVDQGAVHVAINGTNTTQPLISRVGGANGNMSISITAGTTGVFTDTTNEDELSSTDDFNWMLDWAGGTGTLEINSITARVRKRKNASEDLACGFEVRRDGSEDLPAEFISGAAINRGSQNLLGEFISQQAGSQNLPAKFTVRREDSQDLKAGFIVRQPGSQEFKAGFTAGALVGSEDFLAEFVVRQSGNQDLAASFDGQVSLNLPVELVVRQTASQDLLAEFIVAAGSEDLHGALVVRQPGSQDLAASFDAQVSLPGMEQVLFGGWYDLLPTAATEYASLVGYNWTTTEGWRAKLVSTDGVIKSLRVRLSGAPGAGKKYTFTLMLNGNPTALTFDIADAATLGSNMVNEILVTGGDSISLRCVPTGTPTAVYAYWTSIFAGETARESLILGGSGAGLSNIATEYGQVMTGYTSYSITENNFRQVAPTAGTFKNFYVKLGSDPGTAPDAYRFTLRKGGVSQILTVTITANDTTGQDLINSFTVAPGDIITLMIEPLNSPSAIPYAIWGMTFVADIDGESIVMGGARSDLDVAATEYMILTGWGGRGWNADETIRHQLGQVCTLKKLHVLLSGAPGAGNDRDFAIRIAGTNVVTLQISDAETEGDSGALSDTVALDEYVNLRTIPASSPSAADAYWGFVCYIAPAVLQDQEELPGEFIVRHAASQDLGASFDAQVVQSLAAEFAVRRPDSEDLPAQFEILVTASTELPAEFTVRQAGSSDFLGELIVRQPASRDFAAELVVRHPDSEDLPAQFKILLIAASTELPAEFTIRQAESVDLLGELVVRHPDSEDLPGKFISRQAGSEELPAGFISRQAGSQDLAASFDGQVSLNLPGEFTVSQAVGLQNLLGEFAVRRTAAGDLAAEFIVETGTGSEELPGELAVRHPWPLWTNRYWLNGVVQLEEANLSDSSLEEIIIGVMNDIKTWLLAEGVGRYSTWTDIELTPRAIRRATTYGTVASLYARHIFGPKNPVIRLAPMDFKIFTTSEAAMEYWEGIMTRVLDLYLSGAEAPRIWIDTLQEDPVFTMEDIPLYTWDPDDYTVTVRE